MKNVILLCSLFFSLASCKQVTPKTSPFTFNKPGGSPVTPTTATGLTLISPSSSPSYVGTPVLSATGVVSGETIQVYTDSTCLTKVGTATAIGSAASLILSGLSVGINNLYTKSTNSFSSSTCSGSLLSYEFLGVEPQTATSITLQSPTSSPSTVATPTVLLSGVRSGETVYLYVDSACATSYGSAVAAGVSVSITSAALAPGVHQFYTNSSNASGTGTCSAALLSYDYSGILPTAASALTLFQPNSSPNYDSTPMLLASGVGNGDTVNVYTDSGCTALVGTTVSTSTSAQVTVSALAVGTYSFYTKSTNVIGSSPCSSALVSYNYTGPAPTVQVSWTANREKAVNKVGGGYRLYYSMNSGFNVASASFVDVPYVSGPSAPVTKTLTTLDRGTTYFKIVAYSNLNAPSSTAGSESAPSAEFSVTLP